MSQTRVPHRPRRRLLPDLLAVAFAGGAIAAVVGAHPALQAAPTFANAPADAPAPADTPVVQARTLDRMRFADSLQEPLVVRSVNGVLSATLDVTIADLPVTRAGYVDAAADSVVKHVLSTDTLPLRAYTLAATTDPAYRRNDPRFTPRFPGPTFRVRPGDLVQIWLRNKLPRPTTRADSNTVCMTYPAAEALPDTARPYPRDRFQDCFHGPNYTNIHYHGMHVSPDSNSTVVGDDVLMVIAPGDSVLYSFRIPLNQSPGTHWYHPHKHGSVAVQVANGMAGAFIVEDPHVGVDKFTRDHNLREHLIAFQQIDTVVGLFHGDQLNILDKVPPLVNGQNFPVIYMAPGEMQRWRIVNENVTRNTKTLEFRFENRPGREPQMVEVARDGVQFAAANMAMDTDTSLLLGAGNRLDVIVKAPTEPGTHHFRLRHLPGASRRTRDPALPPQRVLQSEEQRDRQQLADSNAYLLLRVIVDPSLRSRNRGLPERIADLSSFLGRRIPPPPSFQRGTLPLATRPAMIVFTDTGAPGHFEKPAQFFLGSSTSPFQRFNDTVVFVPSDVAGNPMPMYLDSTQTWTVVNNSSAAVNVNHPFHIHINPFQVNWVVAPDPKDPFQPLYRELNRAASRNQSPIWLDVIPLPLPAKDSAGNAIPNSAYVVLTQRYDRFQGCRDGKCGEPTGQFVMHCHILGHEERGMMQVLEIVEPASRRRDAGHGGHGAHPGGGAPAAQSQHRH
jgi:FtsP/CotA-like multicopper oxidase with cupredoxin domain